MVWTALFSRLKLTLMCALQPVKLQPWAHRVALANLLKTSATRAQFDAALAHVCSLLAAASAAPAFGYYVRSPPDGGGVFAHSLLIVLV
jgi:hypothetical protein